MSTLAAWRNPTHAVKEFRPRESRLSGSMSAVEPLAVAMGSETRAAANVGRTDLLKSEEDSKDDDEVLKDIFQFTKGWDWLNSRGWTRQPFSIRALYEVTDTENRVIRINLGANKLSGKLPPSIMHLRLLNELHLPDNALTGRIPDAISGLVSLSMLSLQNNKLVGQLPAPLFELRHLRVLLLHGNRFTGKVPPILDNLSNLHRLDLSANAFTGRMPELPSLFALKELRLRANALTGELPAFIRKLPNLEELDISECGIRGRLPEEISHHSRMRALALAHNKFTGPLPSLVGMSSLLKLHLQYNRLTGTIPTGLAALLTLQELDLSHNRLTGSIPTTLLTLPKFDDSTFRFEGNLKLHDPRSALTDYTRRKLNSCVSRFLLIKTCVFSIVDVFTDLASAVYLYMQSDKIYFYLVVVIIMLPNLALQRTPQTVSERLTNVFKIRLSLEAWRSIKAGQETHFFGTARFAETALENIPQMFLQLYVVLREYRQLSGDPILPVSIIFSLVSSAMAMTKVLDPIDSGLSCRVFYHNLALGILHSAELSYRLITFVVLAVALGWWTAAVIFVLVLLRFVFKWYFGRALESKVRNMSPAGICASVFVDSVWPTYTSFTCGCVTSALEGAACMAYAYYDILSTRRRLESYPYSLNVQHILTAGAALCLLIKTILVICVRNPLHYNNPHLNFNERDSMMFALDPTPMSEYSDPQFIPQTSRRSSSLSPRLGFTSNV